MWSRLIQRNLKSRIHRYLTTLAYVFQTNQLPLTAVSTIILNITFINIINKLLLITGVITFFKIERFNPIKLFSSFYKNNLMYYNMTVEQLPCLLWDDTLPLFFNCKNIWSKAVIHNRINQVRSTVFIQLDCKGRPDASVRFY